MGYTEDLDFKDKVYAFKFFEVSFLIIIILRISFRYLNNNYLYNLVKISFQKLYLNSTKNKFSLIICVLPQQNILELLKLLAFP